MHPQRTTVALAAGVGIVCTFLPWVTVPFLGSVDGTKADGMGWITFALCTTALLCALAGNTRTPLLPAARGLSALCGLAAAGIALWVITEINRHAFGRAISTMGIGLYLLIVAGVAIALLPGLIKSRTQRSSGPPPPPPPTTTSPWDGQ